MSSKSENVEREGRRVVTVTFWKLSNRSSKADVVGALVTADEVEVDFAVVVVVDVVVLIGFFVVSGRASNFC